MQLLPRFQYNWFAGVGLCLEGARGAVPSRRVVRHREVHRVIHAEAHEDGHARRLEDPELPAVEGDRPDRGEDDASDGGHRQRGRTSPGAPCYGDGGNKRGQKQWSFSFERMNHWFWQL